MIKRPPPKDAFRNANWRIPDGFTLIELIASLAILAILGIIIFRMLDMVMAVHARSSSDTYVYGEAAVAFERVTTKLSKATLSNYWDYFPEQSGSSQSAPEIYIRRSDLHFVLGEGNKLLPGGNHPTMAVFFLAPLGYCEDPALKGLPELLNACGFFITYGADSPPPVPGLHGGARLRFRLMELLQPAENLSILREAHAESGESPDSYQWFRQPVGGGAVRTIAENVIALIIRPKFPDRFENWDSYRYDSREGKPINPANRSEPQSKSQHELPPVLGITMVVIDEISASRLASKSRSEPQLVEPSLFQRTHRFERDLKQLETALIKENLNFRIFSSDVALPGSGWTDQ